MGGGGGVICDLESQHTAQGYLVAGPTAVIPMMTAIPAPTMRRVRGALITSLILKHPTGRDHNYSHCTEEGTGWERSGNLLEVVQPVLVGWGSDQIQW